MGFLCTLRRRVWRRFVGRSHGRLLHGAYRTGLGLDLSAAAFALACGSSVAASSLYTSGFSVYWQQFMKPEERGRFVHEGKNV